MAELITKLAEQAEAAYIPRYDMWQMDTVTLEKFAEMIVRECALVAKLTEADDGDDYKSGRQWAGIDVLKHFGVEE